MKRRRPGPCPCHKIPHDSIEPAAQPCLTGQKPSTADAEAPVATVAATGAIARCRETGIEWRITGYSERPGAATWEYHLTEAGLEHALELAAAGRILASPAALAREARSLGRADLADRLLQAAATRAGDDPEARSARFELAWQLGEARRWRDVPGVSGTPEDVGDLRAWVLGRLDRMELDGVPERTIAALRGDPWWGYLETAGVRLPSSEPWVTLMLPHLYYYAGRPRDGCAALAALTSEKPVALRLPFVWAVTCALAGEHIGPAVAMALDRAALFQGLEHTGEATPRAARLHRHFVLDVRQEYLALADREMWRATAQVIQALGGRPLRQCLEEMYDWHHQGDASGRAAFLRGLGDT